MRLRIFFVGLLLAAAGIGIAGMARQSTPAPLLMDGHVHITNRAYWENIDAWKEQPVGGCDYARARHGDFRFEAQQGSHQPTKRAGQIGGTG